MGEVVGNTSVMSYSRVPCTPVTGVHVSFYDVFGDVDRIGTGTSWESSTGSISSGNGTDEPLQSEGEEMKPDRVRSHYCRKCKIDIFGPMQIDPSIVFLQEKEDELLRALHEEIRVLKQENSDLKFQVHVILSQPVQPRSCKGSGRRKEKSVAVHTNENETTLKPALEAATKMIEEFKWVQQHYENKINMQERMIEDLLRRKPKPAKSLECLQDFPNQPYQQVTSSMSHSQPGSIMGSSFNSHYSKSGHRRLHNATPPNPDSLVQTSRRNSVQSVLPENYKEQVATLPPIMNYEVATTTPRNTVLSAPKLKHKYGQTSVKSKRSSMTNLQTSVLPPNVTALSSQPSDDSDHSKYDTHF